MAQITTITDILNTWADVGIFAYVLPFLMIFAVVFGILNKINILGDNRGVQATVALAVGLLSLQFDYVSTFFATLFPYAGIGLSVLLVGLILTGLIVEDNKSTYSWILFGTGAVIFFAVLFTSMSEFAWWGGGHAWAESWPMVFAAIVALLLVGFIVFNKNQGGGGKTT